MRNRTLAALGAALAFTALAPRAAAAAIAEKTVEQAIPAGAEVRIGNLAGSVDLVPAGSGPVKVVAQVRAEGQNPTETHELMDAMHWVQEADGTWDLAYPVDRYDAFVYPGSLRSMGSSNTVKYRGQRVHVYGGPRGKAPILYADLSITVPKGVILKVNNAVGPMRGRTLAADLTLDTGSGGVKLDAVAGHLAVNTGSGDVDLTQLSGDVSIATGSGDCNVTGIDASSLRVDTGSGDVTVRDGRLHDVVGKTGSGDIELRNVTLATLAADTGSGEVTVEGDLSAATSIAVDTGSGGVALYGGDGFQFDLTTDLGSGGVKVGYADAELRRDRHEVVGARRGSGQTRVKVQTGSGSVTLAPARRLLP